MNYLCGVVVKSLSFLINAVDFIMYILFSAVSTNSQFGRGSLSP
jgi:hypothetical protein